jgi:DNA invertase Pin-like site-specific DNA recombinase
VAYYRGSAGNGHDIPIAIQRRLTREWAEQNGVEIIREFVDAGTPGNTSAHPPGFAALRQQCVTRTDFTCILCVDQSRWARFDIHAIALLSTACRNHRKQVIYTAAPGGGGDR